MKIALDISVLYIAGAGVFYARYNLVKAMLSLPSTHEFVLLDCFPIPGGWVRNDPPEARALLATGAELREVRGLGHRTLARVGSVDRRTLRPIASSIGRILDGSWGRLCAYENRRRVQKRLAGVDVFHSSEVLQCSVPEAVNVITIHDLTTLLFPEFHTPQVRALQDQKLRFTKTQADVTIAVSESTKRDLEQHLGLDPSRVQVVYNGVDSSFHPLPTEDVRAALSPLGLAPQSYILNVGTIEPRKNLAGLLEAYAHLWQRSPRTTPKLVVVGAQGWLYERVFDRVSDLGLDDRVIFLGRVESQVLPALYNGARLFVYPSFYEGFGLPVLEAMASGTPTITSNVSSLPEIAGDAALLVDPHDVVQIAEAMGELLEDTVKRNLLRHAGRKRAAQFTWDAAARQMLDIYEEAAGTRSLVGKVTS